MHRLGENPVLLVTSVDDDIPDLPKIISNGLLVVRGDPDVEGLCHHENPVTVLGPRLTVVDCHPGVVAQDDWEDGGLSNYLEMVNITLPANEVICIFDDGVDKSRPQLRRIAVVVGVLEG